MKQRGSFSITTLILSATLSKRDDGGITKTRIMQEVMLNYRRINRYLSGLLNGGLIEYSPGNNRYNITLKGIKFLELSEELANYISPLRSMITKYESLFLNEEQLSALDILTNSNERSGIITINDNT